MINRELKNGMKDSTLRLNVANRLDWEDINTLWGEVPVKIRIYGFNQTNN